MIYHPIKQLLGIVYFLTTWWCVPKISAVNAEIDHALVLLQIFAESTQANQTNQTTENRSMVGSVDQPPPQIQRASQQDTQTNRVPQKGKKTAAQRELEKDSTKITRAPKKTSAQKEMEKDAAKITRISGKGKSKSAQKEDMGKNNASNPTMIEVKPALKHALPLGWIHIPKAGSSIANALIHTPGMCPGLPSGIVVNQSRFPGVNKYGWGMLWRFNSEFNVTKNCPGFLSKWGNHQGVGDKYETQYHRKGIIMLRHPEERLVSSYNNGVHDWPPSMVYRLPKDIHEYKEYVQGCTVKMLARNGEAETCGEKPDPTKLEVNKAIRMLNGLAFVGLTEEWDLSICLFRKLFGGKCYGSDFYNTRPKNTDEYNKTVADLNGWKDVFDDPLYKAAQKLFHARLREHGLSKERCEACFKHAKEHYAP